MNEYWKFRLAEGLSRALPRQQAYWVGLRAADRFYARNGPDRQAVLSNLRQIYRARGVMPPAEVLEGLARKTFQYFGKYLVDFFRYAALDEAQVEQMVSREHPEYLDEAVARGKGVLMVSAHFGNWELGGAVLSALGHQVHAVFAPQRLQKLDRLFRERRERRGMHAIPLGRAASGIIRCLRSGEIVALLGDRDFTAKDDRVPFFGKPARMPRGPARLSLHTGAPIVPAFLRREIDDSFLFRLYPPIYPEEMENEMGIRNRLCRILEKEIGDHPYQWFIFEDFWADGDRQMIRGTDESEQAGSKV